MQTVWTQRNNLIWVHTVCLYAKSMFEKFARRCSRQHKQSTFSDAGFLGILTLVMLNPDIACLCKQCRSRSVGFWRSQLIWICTVCHQVCEFIATIRIKQSDWLKIRSGHGILIYSAGQGLRVKLILCLLILPTIRCCCKWKSAPEITNLLESSNSCFLISATSWKILGCNVYADSKDVDRKGIEPVCAFTDQWMLSLST